MARRELLASISAAAVTPLLQGAASEGPVAPVSIARCPTYDADLNTTWNGMFDQLGGVACLVRNKTVTIKVNMTGQPGFDLDHAYDETDVYVSMAKLKNHATCGVTLSLKNCFGTLPASISGGDSGLDEPNKNPNTGRQSMRHEGRRRPSRSAPQELHFGANHDAGYRVPHIVADLAAARPIHLAMIDGNGTVAGGEGPWIGNLRMVKPGVPIAGLNPVCTDSVGVAAMGYNPRAMRGTAPFQGCDNTVTSAEARGIESIDMRRIEARGVPIEQAMFRFQA
jgi:uncharacterized protein (DUF362 family)